VGILLFDMVWKIVLAALGFGILFFIGTYFKIRYYARLEPSKYMKKIKWDVSSNLFLVLIGIVFWFRLEKASIKIFGIIVIILFFLSQIPLILKYKNLKK